jgi:hypothetical protein
LTPIPPSSPLVGDPARQATAALQGYEREQFDAYMAVVVKLAEGWEPIGFVSLNAGEVADLDPVHPDPFEIDCEISEADVKVTQGRCARISTAT